MSITVIKPPACRNCEHWDARIEEKKGGVCDLAPATKSIDTNPDGFQVIGWVQAFLETGPDFYCCHFKQKEGE
jgi:hypothetical protein